ncbi:M28 family peptidase, partial [Candidatus Sumerlaeota bacterium]|nr:M28 family peptidase [Candidatus Sumerlaeota bacterium]
LILFLLVSIRVEGGGFDGERAFRLLEKICSFGPRVPGTPAHQKCMEFIKAEMGRLGYKVYLQKFEHKPALLKKKVTMTNIIAYTEPLSTGTVIQLSSHWDTRPIAERDPEARLRTLPILGANDGASGNAVMLEFARIARTQRFSHHLIFVFFDGEDLGTRERPDEFCLGSRYLAQHFPGFLHFDFGINLDMIGDKDLLVRIEPYSYRSANTLVEEFWDIAQKNYPAHFSHTFYPPIIDDHYPFVTQGKPYINIIDFDYRWWHTQNDTPEQCSAMSLQIIGNTLLRFVQLKLKIGKNFS